MFLVLFFWICLYAVLVKFDVLLNHAWFCVSQRSVIVTIRIYFIVNLYFVLCWRMKRERERKKERERVKERLNGKIERGNFWKKIKYENDWQTVCWMVCCWCYFGIEMMGSVVSFSSCTTKHKINGFLLDNPDWWRITAVWALAFERHMFVLFTRRYCRGGCCKCTTFTLFNCSCSPMMITTMMVMMMDVMLDFMFCTT